MEGSVSISKCAKFKKNFPEGNARKFTVNFAFFGYANVIKCQENLKQSSDVKLMLANSKLVCVNDTTTMLANCWRPIELVAAFTCQTNFGKLVLANSNWCV